MQVLTLWNQAKQLYRAVVPNEKDVRNDLYCISTINPPFDPAFAQNSVLVSQVTRANSGTTIPKELDYLKVLFNKYNIEEAANVDKIFHTHGVRVTDPITGKWVEKIAEYSHKVHPSSDRSFEAHRFSNQAYWDRFTGEFNDVDREAVVRFVRTAREVVTVDNSLSKVLLSFAYEFSKSINWMCVVVIKDLLLIAEFCSPLAFLCFADCFMEIMGYEWVFKKRHLYY